MTALILALGIPLGILAFILYQILKDPNKADQYKALFIKPFFRLAKWGAKTYISTKVSYQVTEFFNRHITKNIADSSDVKINVKWVTSSEDPILKKRNSVIVCLTKSNDQTRNILNSAAIALPLISHPYLRSNLDSHVSSSIDLVTLKKLADKLGNHGSYTYKKYFLDPFSKEDEKIIIIFQKLIEIDNRGYFTPICLNELQYVSEGIYSKGDLKNRTEEVIEFIEYLIEISRIQVGDDVKQWHYISETFNVAIILLANNQRMIRQGVKPYMDRITKNLKQGIESIYILAEENSWDFLKRYQENLQLNDRIQLKGAYTVSGVVENNILKKSKVKIVLLRKIDVSADDLFTEKVTALEINKESIIQGEVTDVSEEVAIVSLSGLNGFIKKKECSWYTIHSCEEVLSVGEKRAFIVKDILPNKMSIELALTFPESDPWKIAPFPKIDDLIDLTIYLRKGDNFYCKDDLGHEFILPAGEISWTDITEQQKDSFLLKTLKVKLTKIEPETKSFFVSIRNLDGDPWPSINRTIRPGAEFVGKVVEVSPHFVKVEIQPNLIGIIPKERLAEAGGAFANFRENIVVGQGIDVFVTRVFIDRKKIHLNLKQNRG